MKKLSDLENKEQRQAEDQITAAGESLGPPEAGGCS